MARKHFVLVVALALAGCEGTWGTPSIFKISPVGGSHVQGLALVNMVCVEMKRGCTTYYTGVELQFQGLHEPGRYGAVIERGTCLQPATIIRKVPLSANANEPAQGLLGQTLLDMGIHHFLKDGYSIALRDRKGRKIACGDIVSDRFF